MPDPAAGLLDRLRRMTNRNEYVVLALGLLLAPLLPAVVPGGPTSLPIGVLALGLVPAAVLAMHAIGVVLVFRANRFINFGQVYIGALAANVFLTSAVYRPALRAVETVCPVCVNAGSNGLTTINYWASAVLAVAFAVGVSALVYVLVVKRFAGMPRLVVTVASIFLAPATAAVGGMIRNVLTTSEQRESATVVGTAPLPFEFSFTIGSARMQAPDVLMVIAAIALATGVALYLRFRPTGRDITAAADNPSRAATIGIDVDRVNLRIWLLVGLVSAVPAVLGVMSSDAAAGDSLEPGLAVRILAVCVVARFHSLPIAVAGAVVFGLLEQAVLWQSNGSAAALDSALVFVVAALLLLQSRERSGRPDAEGDLWSSSREVRPTPAQLREIGSVRSWRRAGTVLLTITVVGLPWALSPRQTNLATLVFIFAVIGLSLLVLTGWAGQVSLGHFAFAAVGAFVVATWTVPTVVRFVGAAVAGAVVATLVGLPALRLKGLYLAVSTLAFAVSVNTLLIDQRFLGRHLPSRLERPSFAGLNLDDERTLYYVGLIALVGVVFIVSGLRKSRFGRALLAARDNEQAVQSYGVSVLRLRLSAFAISGALAAVAGGLYAFHQGSVTTEGFNASQSITMFTMALVGGLSAVSGPILGATYHGLLLVFGASPLLQAFLLGLGGLVLLLLTPGGLVEVAFGLRDSVLRRVAKRHRIAVPSLIADGRVDTLDRPALAPAPPASAQRAYTLPGQWALPRDEQGAGDTQAPTVLTGGVHAN